MTRVIPALLAVLLGTGCAARVFTPPTGASVPFAEAAEAWSQTTTACRDAQRYVVSQMRVQGWVGARDQPIARTMSGAVTRTDDIYLELRVMGTMGFQMGGVAGQSTFVLPTDTRVLRAPTREIVEALTGLQWGGRELLDVLTGCVATPEGPVTGARTGAYLSVPLSASTTAWLREREGRWQVHAARMSEWLVEYKAYQGAWPAEVRVTSTGATPLDLRFTLSQLHINVDLPPETFVVPVPEHFLPMTLDELRSIGPLRARPPSPGPSARLRPALRTPHSALRTVH